MKIDFSQKILILGGDIYFLMREDRLYEIVVTNEAFRDCLPPNGFNLDLLAASNPDLIADAYKRYLDTGTDILKTCTYSASIFGQSDWFRTDPKENDRRKDPEWFQELLEDSFLNEVVTDINRSAVELAKAQILQAENKATRYLAGTLGPITVSLSNPPDGDQPHSRYASYEQVVQNYAHQTEILIDAGVDLLLLDSVFDHLNGLAAMDAIERVSKQKQIDIPTIVCGYAGWDDRMILSDQKLTDFYHSIKHYPIMAFGFTDDTRREKSQETLRSLATLPIPIFYYPEIYDNSGNKKRHVTPEIFTETIEKQARETPLNIAGSFYTSSPENIAALTRSLEKIPPRKIPS